MYNMFLSIFSLFLNHNKGKNCDYNICNQCHHGRLNSKLSSCNGKRLTIKHIRHQRIGIYLLTDRQSAIFNFNILLINTFSRKYVKTKYNTPATILHMPVGILMITRTLANNCATTWLTRSTMIAAMGPPIAFFELIIITLPFLFHRLQNRITQKAPLYKSANSGLPRSDLSSNGRYRI